MKHGIGRKLLSVVLAVMMLVSLLPTAAFADDSAKPIVVNSVVGDSNTGNDTKLADEALVNVGDTNANANEGEGEETTTPVSETVAKIGNTDYATLDAAITAVKDGETIEVNAGEYTLNGSLTYSGKAFTIKAADGAKVSFDMSAAVALHGAKVTFEGVTFDYKTNGNYIGLQHTDTLVYNNCTINGMVFLYAVNETFNNCTFNQTETGAYNVWTYGAQNVAFNSCVFNCAGKAVLVYNEGAIAKTDLTVTDTKFVASAPVTGKAAIEIDTHLMKGGATVTVGNTIATGFANGSNSGSTLWNDKEQTADTNKNTTVTVDGVAVFEPVATAAVAKIGETEYETLQAAFDAAATGDTVTLLTDITLTEQVNITKALNGLTLDGNGKTITCATTTDPSQSGGSALYFGDPNKSLWCTGIKIKDLTMTGTARYGIFLSGGTTTEFTNVNISGNYYIAVNLYGTHGATMTNCNISNSAKAWDKYGSAIWSNVASQNPLKLVNSKVDVIAINAYTTANKLEPKIFVMDGSEVGEIHTFDDGSVSGNKRLCVSTESTGTYTIKEYDETTGTWAEIVDYVAAIGDNKYISLAAAIAAAKDGETVKLLKDVTENVEIAKEKNLTLDLNGKTLSGGTGTAKAALSNLGTITIQDSSAAKSGTIKRDDNGTTGETSYYVIRNQGTMTIESGIVINNSGYRKANSTGSMVGSSLICNGDCDEGGTLTIKGGTFTQNNFIAIKNGALGVLHVTGGTITSNHSAIQNWFKADITGGEIKGQLWTDAWKEGESVGETKIGGDAKFTGEIVMDITGSVVPTLAINGGNLNVTSWRITSAAAKAGAKPAVSGGKFTSAVPAEYCAAGYTPVKNADSTYGVELGNYVVVGGIKGFENTKFASFADAYNAIKPVLETICANDALGQGTPANAAAFDAVFTDVKDGRATLTYTITGNVTYDETGYANLLTMGRRSSHYLTNERHLINFKFVGAEADRGATLTVNSNITLPYEWWGEKITTAISFENLTIMGSAPNGLYTYQSYFEGIDFKVNNCTLKGIKIYNCANVGGSYTITNSTLDGTNAPAGAYAIHLQGNETAPLNITISGNQISGYDRGINIDQNTAVATISGNTIGINDKNRSCIQLTRLASTEIKDNTLNLNGGNAFTLHKNLAAGSKINIAGNTINNDGYLIYDNTKQNIALTYTNNTITGNVDTTKGVYSGNTYALTDGVDVVINGVKAAQIGDVKYETLADAIAAAKDGDTVKLLADATEDVVINKNITLDLGGKTLTNTNAGKATVTIAAGATATVKNGSIIGGTSYYNIQNNGTATFEDVTATAGNTGSSMIDNWGTLTINSGTYTGGLNVVKSEEGSTLTINGGKFTLDYAPSSGYTATILVYGDTTITGGEFIQSVTTTGSWAHPQVVATGVVEGYEAFTTVTGGTFTNKKSGEGIFRGIGKATSDNFEVSGGTFNKSVPDSYFKTGYFAKKTDGGYTVDGPYAVRLGTAAGYATLEEAFAAAKSGDTITLLRDCESDRINLETKSITVDLNGKVLTSTAAYGVMFCAKNGHKITVKGDTRGSKLVGTLMVTAETDGRIEINGGTYESDKYCPIYINGAVSSENSKLTVKNATITALSGDSNQDNGVAVYLAGYSTSAFTKTTITAPVTGLEIRAGKLTLTNCIVTGGSGEVVTNANGNGTTVTNAAVAISQHTTKKNIDVTITGGTYTAAAAVYQTNVQGTGSEGVKASIKSGTFNGAVSAETDNTVAVSGGKFTSAVPENCCADGFIPTANADGTYGVKQGTYVAETNGVKYESLQAAIDAAKRNATVTMLADTKENVTISTPYLTLDLNGFTLNGSTGERKPALTVTARVTVKDSSEDKTGTIMREDTATNSGVSSHYVIDIQGSGWLTFEGGNVKNNSGNAEGKGASLVRVGNDSIAKYPGLNIKGGTFTQDNFIVIKVDRGDLFLNGGTLNSANSYAVENWLRATIKGGTVNGAVSSWTYSSGSNSTLEISGGTVNGNVESVSYDGAEGKLAKVEITGGTVNGTLIAGINNNSTTDPAKATIEVTSGTFKNDPSKYVVENSSVTNNSDGTFGVAKAYLAKVGETSYYTMDEAFKAQTDSGEPIVMLRDYTTGSTFNSGTVARVVDLGGHTWTCTGTDANSAAFEINNPNATLTVKNGKIVSSQLVGLIPSAMGGTIKYDNSSLTFENVEMSTTATSGIETNGNNTNDTVTLKNSTLNVPNGFGIYFPSSGTLTIDNSTINAKTMGVQVCAGSLSINEGSKITVTGDPVEKTENDGAIQDGAAISIVNRTGYKGLDKIEVTGGKFTAKTGNEAIKAYDWANNTESTFTTNDKVAVSGGTFSSAVPAGLCATGYVPTAVDADGNYTVEKVMVAQIGNNKYGTLSEAIAAANAGDTVKLLRDINTPEISYMISKSLTIDLNGKTVTGDGYDAVFQINNADAKVLIKNGNIVAVENTGSAGKYAMAIWACKAECEVTLENLNVSQKITHTDDPQMDMIYASGGTIIINSGNFESGTPAWTLNCKDAAYKDGTANIIVKGGTFTGFDPANNKAEGENTNFVAAGYKSVDNGNGTYTVVKNENVVAVIGTKEYATLSEALKDAAKTGGTVLLVADVDANEDIVQVRAGVTLNLNGYSITNVDLLRVTGKIIDTATEKGIVSAEGYVIGGQNAYTPVYDSARKGYSFFNLSVVTKLEDGVFGGVYFWLNDETEKAEFTSAVALMRADTDGRRVKAVITFTWKTKDYCGTQSYDYTDDFMNRYLNYKDMLGSFYVKAKGLDNIDSVTAQAKFVITDASGDALYTLAGSEITLK